MWIRTISSVLSFAITFAVFLGCGSDSGSSIEYVALGASDATGVGAEPLSRGYVYLIDDRFEERIGKDVDLTNVGIPGVEIEEFVDIQLPIAVEINPDVITIWTGSNDIVDGDTAEDFENKLNELLDTLANDTSAFIVIGNIPDLTRLPSFQRKPDPDVTRSRIADFNERINRVSATYGITVVDLAAIEPDANLVNDDDGFHPNNAGHDRIAEAFLSAMVPVFTQPTPVP